MLAAIAASNASRPAVAPRKPSSGPCAQRTVARSLRDRDGTYGAGAIQPALVAMVRAFTTHRSSHAMIQRESPMGT